MQNTKMKQALEGVKILDFGWVAAGPLSVRYLADFGATVVRIESDLKPDITRLTPPMCNGEFGLNNGGFFNLYNAGKLGISLNIATPKGKEIALRLIQWADMLTVTFTPGTMEKLGLGYEEIKKIKPDIVYVYGCQQGQYGPHSSFAGYGTQGQGIAGLTYITGDPDMDPVPPNGPYPDYTYPHHAVPSILAALDYRRRTGKGVFIDISQVEVAIHHMAPAVMDYFANGRIMERSGNRASNAAPHGAFRCQGEDRWVAITVFTDEEWRAFCQAIGNPAWTNQPEFSTLSARKANEDELEKLVEQWTVTQVAEEVEVLMQKSGVAASVVHDCRDLFEDSQIKHRGFWRRLEHPVAGQAPVISPTFSLSKSPISMIPAPRMAQHTAQVCKEILGMGDDEINSLIEEKVIATE